MSLKEFLASKKGKILGLAVTAAAIGIVAVAIVPTTGTDFNDEVENDFTLEAGDADLSITNGQLDFVLAGTGTDDMQTDTINGDIGGTVPLNVSVCDFSVGSMSDVSGEEDKLQLRVRANGAVKQSWDSVTNVVADGPIVLGKYYPGDAVDVEFAVYLLNSATGVWENFEGGGTYTLCGDEAPTS